MNKHVLLIIAFMYMATSVVAQENQKKAEKTKMDVFASKTGSILKYIDTNLPNLKTSFASSKTRVRKIKSGTTTGYFYQIVKGGKYNDNTASIEYNDLIELLKALKMLKTELETDIALAPDYMENKFITEDGFQVGYYVRNQKASWYINLEGYGSDATLFIDNGDVIETAFTDAKNKIEELMKL